MSEQPLSPDEEQALALPPREVTEVLHGESRVLDSDTSLYPPEQIGIKETLQDGSHSIVLGELTIPTDGGPGLRAALMKFVHPDGAKTFALGGIDIKEDGTPWLNNNFVLLEPAKEYRMGRATETQHGAQTIPPEHLWPGGKYGDLTSRNHVTLMATQEGLSTTDMSTNGTGIHGLVRAVDETEHTTPDAWMEAPQAPMEDAPLPTAPEAVAANRPSLIGDKSEWQDVRIPIPKDKEAAKEDGAEAPAHPSGLNLADQINEGVGKPVQTEAERPVLNLASEINGGPVGESEQPKLNMDAQPTEEPEGYKPPDMQAIFSSGAAFEQALDDQQIDPSVKSGLRRLAESWKELQIAATTTEVWDEMIKPKLGEVSQVVPSLKHEVDNVVGSSEQLAQLFERAANALQYNDRNEFESVIRQAGEPSQVLRNAFAGNEVKGSEDVQRAVTLLSREEVEGDDRIRQVINRSQYGVLSEADAEAFAAKVGPLVHSAEDFDAALQSIKSELPDSQANWRQRQQIIQEATMFARAADSGLVVDPRNIARMRNSLELAAEALQRGYYTPDMFSEIAANARQVRQSYEQVHHLLTRVAAELQAL